MNKILLWEDIDIQTNLKNGVVEQFYKDDYTENQADELITSPFGTFLIKDFFNPMRQYSWSIGHTNFNVTRGFIDNLAQVDGIEKIVPISRYKFMVAFGKCFNINEVKDSIYLKFKSNPPIDDKVKDKVNDLNHLYEDGWFIYIPYKDEWKIFTKEELKDGYSEEFSNYKKLQEEKGGMLISNETDI